MKGRIVVDTGPLVALLNRREREHGWAVEQFKLIRPPAITCEAVISEAGFLLGRMHRGVELLLALLARGVIEIRFSLSQELPAVTQLLARYRTAPMSLADACLVRMSEQHTGSTVLTLDHHFRLYRKHGRLVIPTVMPD